MLSLHFNGSLWFLLLLPPGVFFLWRQYATGIVRSGPALGGWILFALQTLALVLLTLSLTAPELRRHRVEFHPPVILVVRDQSGSFQNGHFLGLNGAYTSFEQSLIQFYKNREFEIRFADFNKGVWPSRASESQSVSHPKSYQGNVPLELTSLSSVADFVDSMSIPNLQAIFLFSDGRANLDSGRASRSWSAPVYPVIFPTDSSGEVQPENVRITWDSGGKASQVLVQYKVLSRLAGAPTLRIVQDGKIMVTRKLPPGIGAITTRFDWSPEKTFGEEGAAFKAILQPERLELNLDHYNDTLPILFPQGRLRKRIFVARPLRSLDEKGLFEILSESQSHDLIFFSMEEFPGMRVTSKDQIWIESGLFPQAGKELGALQQSPGKVVVYSRISEIKNQRRPAFLDGNWNAFSPASEIKVARSVSEQFPDEILSLKAVSPKGVKAPALNQGLTALVEVSEGDHRGLLVGKLSLGGGKGALFLILPDIWNFFFDPQADFGPRSNITAYIKFARNLADRQDNTIRISKPNRAYESVPFDIAYHLPDSLSIGHRAANRDDSTLKLWIAGSNGTRTGSKGTRILPLVQAGHEEDPVWKSIILDPGQYEITLQKGSQKLRSDSLEVAPKIVLELAKIGFDETTLNELASRSGGRLISQAKYTVALDTNAVSSVLPSLPAAETRVEKTKSIRLFNTIPLFFFILLPLALAWLMRKKWDFD